MSAAGIAVGLQQVAPSKILAESKRQTSKGRLWQLEALRGAAAFYVVLHHVWEHSPLHADRLASWFLSHGTAAVIVFFLLSGFVIQYTTASARNMNFRTFFLKRFIRIYPPFVIGLAISYLMMRWTRGQVVAGDFPTLLGNLFMLQRYEAARLGSWFATYCHNEPLWSLTYEWWFYMAFYPIQRYVRRRLQLPLVCGISALGLVSNLIRPNQASMVAGLFIIWWVGVVLAQHFLKQGWLRIQQVLLPYALLFVAFASLYLVSHKLVPGSSLWEVVQFQAECFKDALALLTLGMLWSRLRIPATDSYWRWLRHLAPVSYAVYIFHYPIMIEGAKLLPHMNLMLAYCCLGLVLLAVCYLCEVKLQSVFNRLVFKPIKVQRVPAPLVRSAYSGG